MIRLMVRLCQNKYVHVPLTYILICLVVFSIGAEGVKDHDTIKQL